MSFQLTWLGHGSWAMQIGTHRVLLDPFLDDNPSATAKAEEIEADFILVSHGHFDHVADVAKIAKRTGAQVWAAFEIATWLSSQHDVSTANGMNLGGGVDLPFGRLTMTPALHSSGLPDGSYGGEAAGFVVEAADRRVYFACDTALFSDMKLIGEPGLDLAVLPIGDLYTMGPQDAVAATKLLRPKRVVPAHYNTWPPIEQDAQAWAELVMAQTEAAAHVPVVGEAFEVG